MVNLNEKFEAFKAQFQDLNGVHPGLWPIMPRVLVAFAVFLVVLGLGWFFYWGSMMDELNAGEAKEKELKDAYIGKMQQAINLSALKEQRKLVLQYVATMEKQLPSKAEMDDLLSDISRAGQGRGLNLEQFKPGQVIVKNYYAELPIDIKLTGTYHDIGGFVSDVAKLSRIVTLNNLVINTSKDSNLVMDVVAKTFRYLDKDEVLAQEKQQKGATK